MSDVLDDDVPVHGVPCFVDADWPLFGGAFSTRGIQVLPPKKLCTILQAPGSIQAKQLAQIHRTVARGLPVA